MPTVVNDLILEPKAAPPPETPAAAAAHEKGAAMSPEKERKIETLMKRNHQCAFRHWTY